MIRNGRNQMDRIVLQLMNTIMDYDRFCHVASDLEWIDVEMRHEDWYLHRDPIGIYLDVFTFPDTYIRNHFPEAYVRAVLSSMAFYEEWDKDFWNIPKIQRIACLTQGRALYENYVIRRERRLLMRDWEYLEREIRFFADRNGVPNRNKQRFLTSLTMQS